LYNVYDAPQTAAVREVWPETREQRDGCHKWAFVLNKLAKRLPRRALREMRLDVGHCKGGVLLWATCCGIVGMEAEYRTGLGQNTMKPGLRYLCSNRMPAPKRAMSRLSK
jgi:hypothetical protein